MAHRMIIQMVVTGVQVFGRAARAAYQQASAVKPPGSQGGGSGSGGAGALGSVKMGLEEACKILNVPLPKGTQTDMEHVIQRFKRQFDQNDPTKGGSFYIQSKVLRARERIELEVRLAQQKEDIKRPWRPKMYKLPHETKGR